MRCVLAEIVEDVRDRAPDLGRRAEDTVVVAVAKECTAPPQYPVDAACDADEEPLQAT